MSGKYSKIFPDNVTQSATNIFKITSKRALPKTVEATSDLTDNKVVDKITPTIQLKIF